MLHPRDKLVVCSTEWGARQLTVPWICRDADVCVLARAEETEDRGASSKGTASEDTLRDRGQFLTF